MLAYVMLIAAVLPVVTSQDCSLASVKVCLKAFLGSRVIDPSIPPIDADVPAWNETFAQLKDRCQRYSRFSTCMATVLPSCPQISSELFTGWDNAYKNQLCVTDDSLNQFIQYEQCFGQQELLGATQFCNDTYYAKLATLAWTSTCGSTRNTHTGPESALVAGFCLYTDNYLECLKSAVALQCNKNASDWLYDWNAALIKTQMSDCACSGWEDTTSSSNNDVQTWTIIIATTLGFTLLVVIIGIVVIVVLTQRKKKTRGGRRPSIMPPPPYSTNPTMMYGAEGGLNGEPGVAAAGPSWGTDTLFKFPVLQPPPYGDRAPVYDTETTVTAATGGGATSGAGGEVNPVFNSEEEVGAVGGTPAAFSPPSISTASPSAAAAVVDVTESERELNTAWF